MSFFDKFKTGLTNISQKANDFFSDLTKTPEEKKKSAPASGPPATTPVVSAPPALVATPVSTTATAPAKPKPKKDNDFFGLNRLSEPEPVVTKPEPVPTPESDDFTTSKEFANSFILVNDVVNNPLTLMVYISPFIIVMSLVFSSFFFQNFKGLMYLFVMVISVFIREIFAGVMNIVTPPDKSTSKNCNAIIYTKTANNTFSVFVFSYTLTYLFLPMYYFGTFNVVILFSIVLFMFLDIFIKIYAGCISSKSIIQIGLEMFLGFLVSFFTVNFLYEIGLRHLLYFNTTPSSAEVCSRPSKQTFKCSVYKNGELIRTL